MNRKLILLQPSGVFVMDLNALNGEARFMGSVSDGRLPAKFLGWLSANSICSYVVFVDLPSEEIQIDVIPVAGRGDRRQYLRMLNQKHRRTHCLSKVNIITTDSGKVVQKLGIADDTCAVFLRALAAHGCLIQSIHSPLTLVGAVARRLKDSGNSRIYILPIDGESYRLIACAGKRLVLNRGVRVQEQHRLAEIIADSLRESLTYLRRVAESGWSQTVVRTFSEDLAGHLQKELSSDIAVSIEIVELDHDVQAPRNQSSYTFLSRLAHLAVKLPLLGYRLDAKQDTFLKRRIRHAVTGAATSLLIGATAVAAVSDELVSEYESMSQEHLEIEAVMDSATVFLDDENDLPVEAVRQSLATAKLVDIRSKVSPLPFLYSLSGHQSAYRSIQIHNVDWQRQDMLDIQSLQSLDNQNADEISLDAIYRATVMGAVHGDLEDAMKSFDLFLSSLRKANTNASIRVMEAPFGMSEESRTTDKDISGGGFSLEVVKSAGDLHGR